jgi:hypothetical protein
MALDEEPAGAQHRPAIADRIPIFALLGANVVSSVGNNITLLAVPWFVLETTGSGVRRGMPVPRWASVGCAQRSRPKAFSLRGICHQPPSSVPRG